MNHEARTNHGTTHAKLKGGPRFTGTLTSTDLVRQLVAASNAFAIPPCAQPEVEMEHCIWKPSQGFV